MLSQDWADIRFYPPQMRLLSLDLAEECAVMRALEDRIAFCRSQIDAYAAAGIPSADWWRAELARSEQLLAKVGGA